VNFLNSYLTQDIQNLPPRGVALGAFLTQKGKLVSAAWVLNLPDKFLLLFSAGYGAKVQTHLATFLQFADATLREVNAEWAHFVVLGPKSREALADLLHAPILEDPGQIQISNDEGDTLLFSSLRFGVPGWDLLVPAENAAAWRNHLKALPLVDPEALETCRIEAGIPKMGVDMGEDNLVAEVGLDRTATSFNKGCYLGQETTARVESRGHVNRKLVQVRLGRPQRGTLPVSIRQGDKQVGMLSSACQSPKFGTTVGLAMIQLQAWENPEPILAEAEGEKIELQKL